MNSKDTPLVNVVRRADKEQKITEFLRHHIKQAGDNATAKSDQTTTFLLLARSPASPVARAVATFNGKIRDANISLRVIFLTIGSDGDSAAWINAQSDINVAREIRIINNPALRDAHEQLILGPATSWVGDCLRREPQRNDAYECYAGNCPTTSGFAMTSFERIWLMSDQVLSCGHDYDHSAFSGGDDVAPGGAAAAQLTFNDDSAEDDGPMAATRH